MHVHAIIRTAAALGAMAASLTLVAAAQAAPQGAGADMARSAMPPPPPIPDMPPPPRLPDARPDWRGPPPEPMGPGPAAMQIDRRSRDLWLDECRRRMDMSYRSGWDDDDRRWKRHRRHDRDDYRPRGSDYCEAYLDDYYRSYSQYAYASGYGAQRVVTQSAPPPQNCVTEEHVTYEPVRSRYIPRRPVYKRVPDKRIPDKRIRIK